MRIAGNFADQQLYRTSFVNLENYPNPKSHLPNVINQDRIIQHWDNMTNAVIVWNSVYIEKVVQQLKQEGQFLGRRVETYLAQLDMLTLTSTDGITLTRSRLARNRNSDRIHVNLTLQNPLLLIEGCDKIKDSDLMLSNC